MQRAMSVVDSGTPVTAIHRMIWESLDVPGPNLSSSDFGTIRSTSNSPRQMQFESPTPLVDRRFPESCRRISKGHKWILLSDRTPLFG